MITWLAENSDDEHLKKVKQNAEQHAVKMEVASRSVNDEQALFDEDDQEDEIVIGRTNDQEDGTETSHQRLISKAKVQPIFEGLKVTPAGHKIQEIREMQTVPVSHSLKGSFLPANEVFRSSSPRILPRALPSSRSTVSILTPPRTFRSNSGTVTNTNINANVFFAAAVVGNGCTI